MIQSQSSLTHAQYQGKTSNCEPETWGVWTLDILVEILDLIKALAWPTVALLLAKRFDAQLRELILRIRKGPGGTEFDPPEQKQVPPPPDAPLKKLIPTDNKQLAEQMENIKADPILAQVQDPSEREALLIGGLAQAQMERLFWRTHSSIWASQMKILRWLNSKGSTGDTNDNVRHYYDEAATVHPLMFEDYPWERYLTFLEGNLLIQVDGDRITTTDVGRDYLAYIAKLGLVEPTLG